MSIIMETIITVASYGTMVGLLMVFYANFWQARSMFRKSFPTIYEKIEGGPLPCDLRSYNYWVLTSYSFALFFKRKKTFNDPSLGYQKLTEKEVSTLIWYTRMLWWGNIVLIGCALIIFFFAPPGSTSP